MNKGKKLVREQIGNRAVGWVQYMYEKIFNSNENNNKRKIYVNSTVENVNYLKYYIQFNYI